LLEITKSPHVFTLLSFRTGREILYETLEKVLRIQIIFLVVIRVSELVIHVLIPGRTLYIRKDIFKELLGVTVLLIGIELLRHLVFVLEILALHDLPEFTGTGSSEQCYRQ
jgi:hypothetical protein